MLIVYILYALYRHRLCVYRCLYVEEAESAHNTGVSVTYLICILFCYMICIMSVPVYVAEVAPVHIRVTLVTLYRYMLCVHVCASICSRGSYYTYIYIRGVFVTRICIFMPLQALRQYLWQYIYIYVAEAAPAYTYIRGMFGTPICIYISLQDLRQVSMFVTENEQRQLWNISVVSSSPSY